MSTLKGLCKKYDLDAVKEFWATPEEEIAYIYNGAGPDWMLPLGRKVITYLLDLFQGAFIIHDFDFQRSDKSRENFDIANLRMKQNMGRILDKEYPVGNPFNWFQRARWWWRMRAAYRACDRFGWSAWCD